MIKVSKVSIELYGTIKCSLTLGSSKQKALSLYQAKAVLSNHSYFDNLVLNLPVNLCFDTRLTWLNFLISYFLCLSVPLTSHTAVISASSAALFPVPGSSLVRRNVISVCCRSFWSTFTGKRSQFSHIYTISSLKYHHDSHVYPTYHPLAYYLFQTMSRCKNLKPLPSSYHSQIFALNGIHFLPILDQTCNLEKRN